MFLINLIDDCPHEHFVCRPLCLDLHKMNGRVKVQARTITLPNDSDTLKTFRVKHRHKGANTLCAFESLFYSEDF